jgi:hypothetical protein
VSEWLAFRSRARGKAFTDAVAAFKTAVPSTSRRWDAQHGYWLFDPSFANAVQSIGEVRAATRVAEDDRRLGRVSVREDEELDTDLIDMQFGDLTASDGIGKVQGNPAARAEFERRLKEAERCT